MGVALIFLVGVLVGGGLTSLCIILTKRWVPSRIGALMVGLASTCMVTYLAIRVGFSVAEDIVIAEVVPQWEAQGPTDHGPSAFVVIGMLVMPFVYGVFGSGLAASLIVAARRRPQ